MLRRAVRSMRLLGGERPGAARAAAGGPRLHGAVLPRAGHRLRPDLARSRTPRRRRSARTLRSGTTILDTAVAEPTKSPEDDRLSGDQAFPLHDTYGFPIDLTLEMAAEQGLTVDEEGFRRLMAEQRDRAKADATAQQDRPRRPVVYRDRPGRRRARPSSPATPSLATRVDGALPCSTTPACRRRRSRRATSRWSSTGPRSTPRPAASTPTRA